MYINIEGYKNIEEELKLSLIIPMCPSSQSQDIRNLSFWECSNEKLTSFIFIFLKAEFIIQQTSKHVYRIQFWVFNIFSNEFYFQTGKNRNVEEKKNLAINLFGHFWKILQIFLSKHFDFIVITTDFINKNTFFETKRGIISIDLTLMMFANMLVFKISIPYGK